MKRISIRLKLLFFISILFVAAIGNAVISFQLEKHGEEKLQWVNHTHEVIIETKKLLNNIQRAETGQRGYLITKNSSYLEPYHAGSGKIKYHFELLQRLISDNPAQTALLESIEKITQLKLDELSKTVKLTYENRYTEALEVVNKNKGKKYMDEINDLLTDFINTEKLLLEKRKGDYREHRAQLTNIIYVEIVFVIFLGIIMFSFLNNNLFSSLNLLLLSTKKMENGERLDVEDILPGDEMGYLLSAFFKMHEKIHYRTQRLDYKAHHDELTGLENRARLFDKIQHAIIDSIENNCKLVIFFIDLDKFKVINDSYGHDAGDLILKKTAALLKDAVRSDDNVFRIGGDEFIVMIKNLKHGTQAQKIASSILSSMKIPVMFHGQKIRIQASIGIAVSPDDTDNSDEILKLSDMAMYEAKHDKNAEFKFFDKSML